MGGIGLLSAAALFWLNLRRNPAQTDVLQRPMDRGFIALLFFTSLTDCRCLAWRDTGAMALLLAVHLVFVMALFLTLPYGKFAHGMYRSAALLNTRSRSACRTNYLAGQIFSSVPTDQMATLGTDR